MNNYAGRRGGVIVFLVIFPYTWAQPVNLGSSSSVKAIYPSNIPHISMQYPLTTDEDIYAAVPDNFLYTFSYKTYISVDEAVRRSPLTPLCRSILGTGTVQYKVRGTIHYVPLSPTYGAPQLNEMLNCNTWADSNCKGCSEGGSAYVTDMTVRHPYMPRPGDPLELFGPLTYERVIFESECMVILQANCGARQCRNGQYSTGFTYIDSNGYVTSPTECLPCKPGTWLTCIDDISCNYDIPDNPGDPFIGGNVIYSPYGQAPVGGCFSCDSAGGGKVHYGKTQLSTYIEPGGTSPLQWYCPGGVEPPVMCRSPFVGSDPNHTMCVCPDGWYSIVTGCAQCQPGYMCPGGYAQECPDHTYQDTVGATSCNRCTSDGTATGDPLASCLGGTANNAKVLRKCIGRFKAEAPQCVSCNMCKRDYVSSPAGQVDCYA